MISEHQLIKNKINYEKIDIVFNFDKNSDSDYPQKFVLQLYNQKISLSIDQIKYEEVNFWITMYILLTIFTL